MTEAVYKIEDLPSPVMICPEAGVALMDDGSFAPVDAYHDGYDEEWHDPRHATMVTVGPYQTKAGETYCVAYLDELQVVRQH